MEYVKVKKGQNGKPLSKSWKLEVESMDFLTSCGTSPRRSPPCTGTGWRASCTRRRSHISPCKYDPKRIRNHLFSEDFSRHISCLLSSLARGAAESVGTGALVVADAMAAVEAPRMTRVWKGRERYRLFFEGVINDEGPCIKDVRVGLAQKQSW